MKNIKLLGYSLVALLSIANSGDFDPSQKYLIENEFSGQILGQYTSNPPALAPRILTNDKEIHIFTKIENGKEYVSFASPYGMQNSDPNKYKRFANPSQAGEELSLKESGPIWWEVIPHISKDGHKYGYVYLRNKDTGLYMKDTASIDNSLDLRSPDRKEAIVTADTLENPDDRRYLWQITPFITTPPSLNLALPQSGWTPKANKIAILSLKDQLNSPTFRVLDESGRELFSSKGIYWGKYWDNLHFYTLNLNNKKLEKEGTYQIEVAGIKKKIYIKNDIFLHPMRQKGSDRFSISEIFSPDFGFVTQWGRLVNWWPKPYEFLSSLDYWSPFDKNSPNTFPDWMWRDDSDANRNGVIYEPYGGKATYEEANNCYKGSWDMTDQYAHNYAYDGLVLNELSLMYQNSQNPNLKEKIYKEILYGVDGLLKRQESDGSWRQGYMDKLKWTGTNAGLGAGLASTLPIIREKDPNLASRVEEALNKSWSYVNSKANDPSTWAVAGEGKLPDGSTVASMLPTQRNLFRESYLFFAINMYLNTKDKTYKDIVEKEAKEGTIYHNGWFKKGGVGKFPGQFTAHGEWALIALLKYYPFASDETKKAIEQIATDYYNSNIISTKDYVGGPYGAYGKYLSKNGTAYTWQVWKNMLCATMLYKTLGDKFGQGVLLAQKALDWYWGSNPYSSSLVFGVGDFYVNSGWASYHTIGRHIGMEASNMHLKGSDGAWASSETTVVGSLAIWNSVILLDKYRDSLKGVEIFTKEGFSGDRLFLPAGKYNSDLLKAYGIALNDVSSLKVPENFRVKLYTGGEFNGESEEIEDDTSALGATNNRVQSIEVIYTGEIAPALASKNIENNEIKTPVNKTEDEVDKNEAKEEKIKANEKKDTQEKTSLDGEGEIKNSRNIKAKGELNRENKNKQKKNRHKKSKSKTQKMENKPKEEPKKDLIEDENLKASENNTTLIENQTSQNRPSNTKEKPQETPKTQKSTVEVIGGDQGGILSLLLGIFFLFFGSKVGESKK